MADSEYYSGDPERTKALMFQIGEVLRDHLLEQPRSRERVYEALDAIAFAAALTIKGSDHNLALEYFSNALNQALKNIPNA
jgi:hypothetical protein